MAKFYFLNNRKQWQGPYWYPQILLFALNGTVEPDTYLWHNKLAPDVGESPMQSIYARNKASEFRFLPMWVFGYNLRILALNTINKWKKKFKKDDWAAFAAKPLENDFILKDAENCFMIPTIIAIHDFAAPGKFRVKLIYFDLDNEKQPKIGDYPIRLTFDNDAGIKFEITMDDPPSVGGVEHLESYGLHRDLGLLGEHENVSVARNSVFDFSTRFPYRPQILKGRFRQGNLISKHKYLNCYTRLVIKLDDDKPVSPQNVISTTGTHLYDHDKFNVHPSLMGISFKTGGSFSVIVVAGLPYKIYSLSEGVLAIDGIEREDLSPFRQKAEVMRVVLALMSGKFYGGVVNYVTSPTADFKEIDGIWYEIEKQSVLSNRRAVNLQTFRASFKEDDKEVAEKYKEINGLVDPQVFSALCDALWDDENLLHTANLIISAMGNPDPLQQGALYSVALETLTSSLGESKSTQLKPIADKATSKSFVSELKSVLLKYRDSLSEEANIILTKNIEGINRPTNQDKLIKTFELYGITLSDLDQQTIGKRNAYLHGRNPLDLEHIFELTQISLRLHSLLVALLLKYVGYNGHIINLDVNIYLTDETKMFEAIIEEEQMATKIIARIEKAKADRNEKEFNAAKVELAEHIKNHKFNDLIRLI